MRDADGSVLQVHLAHVVVLVAHAHLWIDMGWVHLNFPPNLFKSPTKSNLSNGQGDAAVGRREDAEARLVENLEGPGGDDSVALVPRYHS